MSSTAGFKKLGRTMKIFGAVQFGLVALLVYVGINFQDRFLAIGRGNNFVHGIIAAAIIQLIVLYPIKRFAAKEVERDLYVASTELTKEEIKVFTKKKRYSDIAKISTFGFYTIFILAAPTQPLVLGIFVLSVIYYSFVLTILAYLQCYNYAAKKLVKGEKNAVNSAASLVSQKK